MKKYKDKNVYEAFNERLENICKYFDHLIISFSGGKDSGVMLELVHKFYLENELEKTGIRVSVFYLDYEGNYQETREYVNRSMGKFKEFDYYHLCMPVSASCGISMTQSTWLPWDPEKKNIWVSDIPNTAIHLDNHNFSFFEIGMSDYAFQRKFCEWLHHQKGSKRTAILVGIRAQESLNRYNAVTRETTFSMFGTFKYSHRIAHNIFNFYPIYDWQFEDVWIANNKFDFDYNRLYDLYYQAGVSFKSMRVANPFHQCGVSQLKLYRALEPQTWGKLLGRVNGANFASIYGGTKALGYGNISLPKGHTWKSYVLFLLQTLPKNTREAYIKKFQTSINYWTKKGGTLPLSVVEVLDNLNLNFEKLGPPQSKRRYKQPYETIRFQKYPDDIVSKYFRLLPSYKRMCVTILKNDTSCQYMGFGQTRDELQKKKEAIDKWEKILEVPHMIL